MAGTKLIPGFRFHPTDVELVKYFLKRKILGKRFPFDVIAEIDIYKYAPWDLPDKSSLKTGDLEWYFFCPRGKKYSSGGRMNRATEVGYWKTTGKDRSVEHKNEVVGMIKTLVFHTGRAPKGDRTDWVMHEFRLEDKELADKGIPQDLYVICRVFQKEGPGLRNGAQYGKPFNEEDWDKEDEIDCVESLPIVALSALDPIQLTTCHNSVANDMRPSTSECIGLTSGLCLSGLMPSCSTHPLATPSSSTQADDDILLMLDTLKEDNTLALNENNRIEDNASSLASRVKKTDAREIQAYYQQYYEHYVRALDQGEQADRAQLGKAYHTAGVLFEVLCAVNKTGKVEEVAPEITAAARDVQEKTEIYVPFNILPLDSAGASRPIMQLEEIKAAVSALWNTRGLSWPSSFEQQRQRTGDLDLLDWLRAMFGFQRDNVRNQREHLILLLANSHIRLNPKPEPLNKLDDRAINAVMNNLFKNYKTWCKFLGRKHSLRLPQGQQEMQQRKLLYMGLYLLIWGEASNLRFMPECLCYIFHNMAYELHGLLAGNVSIVTGENIKPSYGGHDEAFLRKVITPIYHILSD